MSDPYRLKVNEEFEFELYPKEIDDLDVRQTGPNSYHLLKNGLSIDTEVIESNYLQKSYVVKVNAEIYRVSISDQMDLLIDQMGFSPGSGKDVGNIMAPMPGLILDIHVRAGQVVNEDDPLLILEAMKMENVITSPRDGIIKGVTVKKGEAVDKKHILIEFE